MPPLPKNASGDENYDARRLRDGYVYILAVNAEVEGCFEISAEAANGQAWYIYRYRSKDVDFNQGNQAFGINYSFSLFNDYEAGYTNKVILPTPYIELNKAIESAYNDVYRCRPTHEFAKKNRNRSLSKKSLDAQCSAKKSARQLN